MQICELPVVCHVTLDQVASSQSSHQWELSSQHGGTNHPGQLPGILPWTVLTGSLHTQHLCAHTHTHTQTHDEDENKNYETMFMLVWLVYVCVYLEAGLLRGQVGTSSYCAQLYRGHCAADVQVLPCWSWCLHQGYAVTATHWLGWILGNKHTQP